MANSLDQIFRNFINRITGGDDEDTVAEKQSGQGGLMAPRVVRPRARPEDVEPIGGVATGAASTGNIAIKRFVDGLNQATKLDVSLRPRARPLENTLIDANLSADTLQLKHNMPVYKFQQENESGSEDGSTIKISPAPTSDAAIDEIAAQATSLFEKVTRPRARPKSVEEIQAIRASQEYTDLDTTRGLQVALNNAGITVNGKPLAEDGIMGPLTKKAIRAFQKDKGLKVDGIAGPITKQALYGVAPQPKITEEELQPSIYDKPAQEGPDQMQVGFQDPSIVDPTTSRPYTAEGLMRREQALIKKADEFLTSEDYTVSVDEEDAIPAQTPNIKTSSIIPRLKLSKKVSDEVDNLNAIEKVKALGYIKNQYIDFLTSPSVEKGKKIIADIKSNRYGGFVSNLDENNPKDAKIIEQFFKNAIGKNATFDATSEAWCALFVDHILNEMGAGRLGSDQGGDVYDRVRARSYENYGEEVLGKSPTEKDFNANAKVGDIVVIHSSFVVKKPDGDKQWFSVRNVKQDSEGKYTWVGDPTDDIMQAEVAKMNDGTYNVDKQYHVGFNVGKAENGMLEVLGGNQNDQVNVRGDAYSVEYVMAVRRITPKTIQEDIN